MNALVGRTAALHAAFWQYDRWYRWAWFVWPQALAILVAGWLVGERVPQWSGRWAKPVDCASPSNPGCAATRHPAPEFPDEVINPTTANRGIITIDRTAFATSAAADRPRLTAGLAAYYRSEWQQGIDALKPADANDRNVQFVLALLNLGSNTFDSLRIAQGLLRKAADAGQRQAGVVLGGTLMGWQGLPKDVPQGRRLIENGAAAGDPYAMRLAAIGYLTGEFGTRDAAKALNLMQQAADTGDPVAMAHLGWLSYSGRGGIARDEAKAVDYLRRAAEAGVTSVQFMLALWAWERYTNEEPQDPSEVFKWYERAYQRGHSVTALGNLAVDYWLVHAPWTDTSRSFSLLQLCARYAYGFCHFWLGAAYHAGSGTPVDRVKAYAAYTVARQLGFEDTSKRLEELDASMLPAAKAAAVELARRVSAGVRPVPAVIELQTAEAIAGPSPWGPPPPQASEVPVQPSTKPATTESKTDRTAQASEAPVQPSTKPAATDSKTDRTAQASEAPVQPSTKPATTESKTDRTAQASADWPVCEKRDGDPDLGIAACERLIGSGLTGTDLGWAHYGKGWHHGRKNQHDQAILHFGEAIRLQTNLSWARNGRGVENLRLGNLDAALRDFNDLIASDSSFPLAYANRGAIFRRQNQPDKAIADTTQALRLDPKLRFAYDVRSGAYEDKQQWAEVVADCTAALELDPKDRECLDRRGNAYLRLGKSDLALADLDESLRLEPRSPWTLTMRGNLRRDKRQLDLAIEDYTKAISQKPDYVDAYANRADVYVMKKQHDLAISDATRAIELDRNSALGFASRGRAQTELGRLDDAVRDLSMAVSLAPKNPFMHYFAAVAEARLEERQFAACPKPGSQRPTSSTTFGGGGPPVCMTGIQYGTAIYELDQAIQLKTDWADAYAYRGSLYLAVRQRDKAVADLRKALAIDPKNEFARGKLRSINVSP